MSHPGTMPRTGALTDAALAVLAGEYRVAPSDVFTEEQYAAIRRAGLEVFFVRADSLLGS